MWKVGSYGVEGGQCVEVQCDAGDVCVITLMCVGVSVYKNCGCEICVLMCVLMCVCANVLCVLLI